MIDYLINLLTDWLSCYSWSDFSNSLDYFFSYDRIILYGLIFCLGILGLVFSVLEIRSRRDPSEIGYHVAVAIVLCLSIGFIIFGFSFGFATYLLNKPLNPPLELEVTKGVLIWLQKHRNTYLRQVIQK